ncbi:STAS domain-containing protein [Wenzhouxiangella sp. AB-CW3]|uniref:STAS domain-containing protein n=1 Tax=Wenzhouxiangella sp. AB-CW3 TaxID=2771012 RepID=UPI00168BEBB4|nr:STAS domain-containing protein [Wenzhouxiangella sp. AB-CW3]QOC21432.1 STAS domain-containing protein [Wenzhouxiangella sp. AB-CW3]
MTTETLSGDLTMKEVPATWQRLSRKLPDELDLSGLDRIDSSALALLLECRAAADTAGRDIVFRNPPETLRTIARLTQVEALLGWNGAGDEGVPA